LTGRTGWLHAAVPLRKCRRDVCSVYRSVRLCCLCPRTVRRICCQISPASKSTVDVGMKIKHIRNVLEGSQMDLRHQLSFLARMIVSITRYDAPPAANGRCC
jgi:hypothetical protein